jgi:hypothetical protein
VSLTFTQLQDLMKSIGLRYWVHPSEPSLFFNYHQGSNLYQVIVALRNEGTVLQIQAINYLSCEPSHPHLAGVLKTLAAINSEWMFVKFCWDPRSGEISAMGDIFVMDGTITVGQFERIMSAFVPSLDYHRERIRATQETGTDPGDTRAPAAPPSPKPSDPGSSSSPGRPEIDVL